MVLPTLLVVIDRTMDTTGEIAERFSVEGAYVLMDRKLKAELINAFLQTESLFR